METVGSKRSSIISTDVGAMVDGSNEGAMVDG